MSKSSVVIESIGAHDKLLQDTVGGTGGNLSMQGLLGHIRKPIMLMIITTYS